MIHNRQVDVAGTLGPAKFKSKRFKSSSETVEIVKQHENQRAITIILYN